MTPLTLLIAVAVIATACGSGESGTGLATVDDVVVAGDSTSDTVASLGDGNAASTDGGVPVAEVDIEEAMLAFAQCMRDEGVEMADPELDADGNFRLNLRGLADAVEVDREVVRIARDACSEYLEGVTQQFQDFDRSEIEDQLLAFAVCMRDNGYDVPDPDLSFTPGSGGGDQGEAGRVGPFGDIDPQDPVFIAAAEICQTEFSFGGPGGLPGGGRGGVGG